MANHTHHGAPTMLNALIVDDEPLAHQVILHHLIKHPDINVTGQCFNAKDALCVLATSSINLVFLDINMPELSGIELLKVLAKHPQVIIISAYQEYALEGFELDVTDYLLKPVSAPRLEKALEKVRLRANQNKLPLCGAAPSTITLKIEREKRKFQLDSIDIFEAYGNYVKVWQGKTATLVNSTLKQVLLDLDSSFMQVHKSYVINKSKVVAINTDTIQLASNAQVKIGKSYKPQVRDLL